MRLLDDSALSYAVQIAWLSLETLDKMAEQCTLVGGLQVASCSFQDETGEAAMAPLDASQTSDEVFEDYFDRPIGARKKGRRKGCKNRPALQRHMQAASKKRAKNAKERKRVQNIHHEYTLLRMLLGDRSEKLSKLQVLNATIEYIKYLRNKLAEADSCSDQGCVSSTDLSLIPQVVPSSESLQMAGFSLSPYCSPASSEESTLPVEGSSTHLYNGHYSSECVSHGTYNLVSNDSYAEVIPCPNPLQIPSLPPMELTGVGMQPNSWFTTPNFPPPLSHYSMSMNHQ